MRLPESGGLGGSPAQAASLIGGSYQCGITDRREEFGPESETYPRQTHDALGQRMPAKSGLERRVGGCDAHVEVDHPCANSATSSAATSSPESRTVCALAAATAA